MGIKLFSFIRRRADLSPAEFHAYWRDEHAPWIATNPDLRRHLGRYELHHRDAEDYARDQFAPDGGTPPHDGVAVMWFDSLDALAEFAAVPGFAGWRAVDAPRFREPDVATVTTDDPTVIVDDPRRPDAGLKLTCILRRHPDYDDRLGAFHEHWREYHGGLYRTVPELRDPLFGYDQNHTLVSSGPDDGYDGVTEQWFADLPEWYASLGVPANRELVEPDVASFLDARHTQFVVSGPPTVVVGD